jgi:hypothetical protein
MAARYPGAPAVVRTSEYEDIYARLYQVRSNLRHVDVQALSPEMAQYLADSLNTVGAYLHELGLVHGADTEDDLIPHRLAAIAVHRVMETGPRDPTLTSVRPGTSAMVWQNCTSLLKAVHRVEEQAYPERPDGWYGPRPTLPRTGKK